MRHFTGRSATGRSAALLAEVVRHIAHYPIRNRGTFCGSLAHADPASEWCPVLAALDGEVLAKSARGERVIAARDFFKGVMTTALADDELLVEARLPLLPADTACGFYEFSRRAGDFAMAAALGVYRLDGGKIAEPRSLRLAAPKSIRGASRKPNARSFGAAPGDAAFRAAAQAATAAIDPMEDNVTTAEFRRDLVLAATRRALERAANVPPRQSGGGGPRVARGGGVCLAHHDSAVESCWKRSKASPNTVGAGGATLELTSSAAFWATHLPPSTSNRSIRSRFLLREGAARDRN